MLCDISARGDILHSVKIRRFPSLLPKGRYLIEPVLKPGKEYIFIFIIFGELEHTFAWIGLVDIQQGVFSHIMLRFYIPGAQDNRPFSSSHMAFFIQDNLLVNSSLVDELLKKEMSSKLNH